MNTLITMNELNRLTDQELGKRCASPVVSARCDLRHFILQLGLREACHGAPK